MKNLPILEPDTTQHNSNFIFFFFLIISGFNLSFCYSQTSNPPPNGYERGMYVDCADLIIAEMALSNFNSEHDLIQYAISRHITYMALFGLDIGGASAVINDPAKQIILSTFIVDLKSQLLASTNHLTLEVGMVISSKDPLRNISLYDYGNFIVVNGTLIGPCTSDIMIGGNAVNKIINPDPNSNDDTKNLALMARNCFAVKYYNDGPTEEAANIPFVQNNFSSQGHSGHIDWISLEKEYWSTPDLSPITQLPSYLQAYNNYLDLIHTASLACCSSNYTIKLESELTIKADSINASCNCPSWNNMNNSLSDCPPTGQIQANAIDGYLDRVLLNAYYHDAPSLFNAQCFGIYYLGNSSTNKRTLIWPLFSVEFPEIGESNCKTGAPIICDDKYLGLFLQPNSTSITLTCDNTQFTDGGGDFNDAESDWIYSMTHATNCTECGIDYNTVTPTGQFTAFKNNNDYTGFMWFTYTFMYQQNFHRLRNNNNASTNQVNINIFPNPGKSQLNIKVNELNSPSVEVVINILNNLEEIVFTRNLTLLENNSTNLDLNNLNAGIYYVKISTEKEILYHGNLILLE